MAADDAPAKPDAPEPNPVPVAAAAGMDVNELTELVGKFNESTARLKESHERLRARVDELANELARKNVELSDRVEEISSLKNYLANILGGISDGVLAVDLDGRLSALNDPARALLDLPAGAGAQPKGEGTPRETALDGRAGPVAGILLTALDEERSLDSVEVNVQGADGQARVLSVSAAPLREAGGARLGAVATFRDNTELRRLEETLRRRDRLAALGEMAAQLAHEIRNPLGGIELYASLLDRSLSEDAQGRELLSKIAGAAGSLNRVVEDMLTFTRPSVPDRRPVRVGELLDAAVELAGGALADGAVDVDRVYKAERPVAMDPGLMQRAFLNVILNAVQAMEPGGRLRLEAALAAATPDADRERLVVRIADTGAGVPAELRDKIFDPFFTSRDGGTGLGLAIVHKIVQDHGGTVRVEENAPRGAVFVFDLPVSAKGI